MTFRTSLPPRRPARAHSLFGRPPAARVSLAGQGAAALESEADSVAARAGDHGLDNDIAGTTPAEGSALKEPARSRLGGVVGFDLSQVRLHADARAEEVTGLADAEALTIGKHIYFGAGALRSGTVASERLLVHELAHVAQQSRTGVSVQPKLKLGGDKDKIARVMTLLNTGLELNKVKVSDTGEVSIKQELDGPPTPGEQALVGYLTTIINDTLETSVSVSASSRTLVGSYATGDIDVADLEVVGVGGLIHELVEQYQKQKSGKPFGSETTGAHGAGIDAESAVTGAIRGSQKMISSTKNPDGTLDAVVEIPFTYPDGKVKTMVLKIEKNNVKSKTWK
jgi:Domain of unknown function (DUF4157)